eukprot:gnl/TRDRNA2_/TRDRNA2_89412_c1_seq1.p1 gnl/TRDRNA2_/TRDRNA2_89412_c1~~gnl/TRDRNA2_/TRDRNA2_89412_c1_seq1.p1  ORF type:complete len:204 (+),score=21.33 gnl/TRDRNA2_/TRDRNA2_89412_c1_seq1:103-714(+)
MQMPSTMSITDSSPLKTLLSVVQRKSELYVNERRRKGTRMASAWENATLQTGFANFTSPRGLYLQVISKNNSRIAGLSRMESLVKGDSVRFNGRNFTPLTIVGQWQTNKNWKRRERVFLRFADADAEAYVDGLIKALKAAKEKYAALANKFYVFQLYPDSDTAKVGEKGEFDLSEFPSIPCYKIDDLVNVTSLPDKNKSTTCA